MTSDKNTIWLYSDKQAEVIYHKVLIRVTPPRLVCAQLWQDKMRTLGTVSIKHIHAVFRQSRLGARSLARRAFSGFAWHFCVVIVGNRADGAEIGARIVRPHAVAVLRVWNWCARYGGFLLARHLAVVKQVLRWWRYAQYGPSLWWGVLKLLPT